MQHARGMSGQQAIDALLQAQRTGGTVKPEVTIFVSSPLLLPMCPTLGTGLQQPLLYLAVPLKPLAEST